ncbi:V-type ATPase subunit [Enterococcus sp.]|uniref:V-type ATPase subunit n=1 Tax=Enterococcus sp. TaxID=35783 RepID=UPI003C735383
MAKEMYHQLNPLIRLKETELLTTEVFQQLIDATDFKKIVAILTPTVYGQYLTADFQQDFEKSLNQELLTTFEELEKAAPDANLVWVYTMRYTFHNLKVLTKAYYVGEDYDYLYLPDGLYGMDELKHAVETGKSATLPEGVLKSIQEVKEGMEESRILQGIDVIYDRSFLTEQRRLGEALGYPELLEEIIAFIDLTNLITSLRCLQQHRSQAFMSTVLSSSGSIEKEVLMRFAESDPQHLVAFIRNSSYGDLLAPAFESEEIDYGKLDLIKDNYLTQMFASAQTTAFGPLPLLAFLNAKDIEIKNLRLILVGKRAGFSKSQLQERMRMTYGV